MNKRIRIFINSNYSLLILLFMLSFACYGLLAPWSRFYHDELSILWFQEKMGNIGIFFEGNRPLLKYVYQPLIYLFGSNSMIWSFFSVLTRWLFSMSLFWLMKLIWPEKKVFAVSLCFLSLVYPGFQVQFSSMIFSISFLIFSLFVLSIYFSIKFINCPNHKFILLLISLFFSAVSLLTNEYFFTLELIRYYLIWVYLYKSQKDSKIINVLKTSSPYLILFFISIIWRVFQENNETTYSLVLINNLKTSFFPTILSQLSISLHDIWYTSIKVWLNSFYPSHLLSQQGQRIVLSYFALVFVFFWGFVYYFKQISFSNDETKNLNANLKLLGLGVMSLVLAGIPFWLAGLPVDEKYFYSRWTIPFIIGSCIIVTLLILHLIKNRLLGILLLSALISFGFGTQFLSANSFRQDWNNQNLFYWELKWRIPSLKENTVFFSDMLDFHYENSDQLSSGINFALAKDGRAARIPYFLFYLPERIDTSILPELMLDIPIKGKRYYSSFEGNTSQAIIIDYNPPGCMKILDPNLDLENPNLSKLTKQALFLSKNGLIKSTETINSDLVSSNIIGSEPTKAWCYFFEKADLANQFQDWDVIGKLYQEVNTNQYKPRDGREWVPFIEGLSHLSDWKKAALLTDHALETTAKLEPLLCELWEKISNETPTSSQRSVVLSEIHNKLKCNIK